MRKGDEPCVACDGGARPCKGGGNLLCWRRDPKPARIATILDTYGGNRFIVGHERAVRANTRHDELCHIVPDLIVHEPIAWNDIPIVIERAKLELFKWLDTLPNLTETEQTCVTMYRLRLLEMATPGRGTLQLNAIVET